MAPPSAASRRLRQADNQVLDRFLQTRNALPGEQLHAGRALELRQFLLEGEQAQASGGAVCGLFVRWCCLAAQKQRGLTFLW